MKLQNDNLASLASVGIAYWLQSLHRNMCMDDAVDVSLHALKLAYSVYAPPGKQINIAFVQSNGNVVWIRDSDKHVLADVVYMISVRHSPIDVYLQSAGVLFTRKRVFLHATPIAIRDETPCAIGSFVGFINSFSRIFCTTGERVRDRETYKSVSQYIKTLPLR